MIDISDPAERFREAMLTASKQATTKDAAVALALGDIAVFPCGNSAGKAGKKPLVMRKHGFCGDPVLDASGKPIIDPRTRRPREVNGGFHKATTNVERIAGAWTEEPNALVGIVPPPSLVMVDLDVPGPGHSGDGNGIETLKALEKQHGDSVQTFATGTPSGGVHLWFTLPAGVELPQDSGILPGIDTRVSGKGYSIDFGTLEDGRGYGVIDDAPVAEMPAWFIKDLLDGKEAKRRANAKTRSSAQSEPWTSPCMFRDAHKHYRATADQYEKDFSEECAVLRNAPAGERNNQLNTTAFKVGQWIEEGGVNEEQAREALVNIGFEIGLDSAEIFTTVNSGIEKGKARPYDRERLPSRLSAPMQSVDPLDRLDDCAPRQGVYEGPPPPYNWLFTWLLEQGELAVLAGPGGSGKSTAALQGIFAVGTGRPWLYWYNVGGEPGEAWYLSSEDSQRTLHRKADAIMETLTPAERGLARRFVRLMHLPSRYCLLRQDSKTREVVPTEYWQSFREKVMARRPRLIVLDPLSSVMLLTETDNTATTDALGYLEELCEESGTCILFLHHVTKAGSLLKDPDDLVERLDQTAVRGAGAIVNAPRMALLLYPLSVPLAKKCLEDGEAVKTNGQIVACAEVKKNSGILAPLRFFRHTSNMGLLEPCLNVRSKFDFSDRDAGRDIEKLQKQEENARLLAEEAVRREQSEKAKKRRISPTNAAIEIGATGNREKSNAIAAKAQAMGLVFIVNVRDLVEHGFAAGRTGGGRAIVPSIEALRKYGQPDPEKPGEWLNVSAELRQWIEAECTDDEPEAEAVQQEPEAVASEAQEPEANSD